MLFRLKRHLIIVLAAVVAGFGVSSGAVAQEASQNVLTNDNPNRTTKLGSSTTTGKVVNPRGFKITITGGDAAIVVGDSTDGLRSEVVNEGPLSTALGRGIEAGVGARVINRGPIETQSPNTAIDVDNSTEKQQSTVENYAPITTSGDGGGIKVGNNGKVINRGPITTEGSNAYGIEVVGTLTARQFQSAVENYAAITTKGGNAVGIKTGEGARVINRGPIETAGDGAQGIWVGASTQSVAGEGVFYHQSVVENYADITTAGESAHPIYALTLDSQGDDNVSWVLGGVRVLNRGNLRATGTNSDGIRAGSSLAPDPDNNFPGYQTVIENYGDITAERNAMQVGRGVWVINYGKLRAGSGHGIQVAVSGGMDASGNNLTSGGYQSVVENYGDITAADQSVIRVGGGGRVINWGTIRKTDTGGHGIEVGAGLTNTTGYQSVAENYGNIFILNKNSSDGINVGVGGRAVNWGTVHLSGIPGSGSVGIKIGASTTEYQSVVENFGRVITRGERSGGIQVGEGGRMLNRGVVITEGKDSRGLQGVANDQNVFRPVVENDGSVTTRGDGTAYGIDAGADIRVVNRGSIITTGGVSGGNAPHGINYAGNTSDAKAEELINEGFIHVSGVGVNAIHTGVNSIVTNRGSLISLNGKAINFTGGNNHLTLGSESYIVGNINLGGGTRVALDLSGGGSGLWQGEGTLTGEVTASGGGGNMAWAYNKDTGQLAIFDASVFSSGEDTLAAASSGVSDLVGGRLDRLAGVAGGGGNPSQVASLDGGMLTGPDAAVGVWFSTGGGIQQFDRYATTPETTQVSWSGVLGVDYTPLDRSYTVGLFTGYVSNDTWGGAPVNAAPNQKRSFERDDSGVVAGVYGRVYHGSWFADAGLSFGYSDFDHRRWTNDATQDNGLSVLWASQDGWWVRPQLRVGHAIPLQGGWTAIPSLSVSYGRQHLSGYKEKGTSGAAMEVKSRTVSFISGGGQLALERAVGRKGTVRFHGGYDYRDSVGSQTTKVRLLGQDRSVTSSSKARHEFSAGIGGSYALGPGIRVEMWGSALFGPDNRGGHGGLDLISHF